MAADTWQRQCQLIVSRWRFLHGCVVERDWFVAAGARHGAHGGDGHGAGRARGVCRRAAAQQGIQRSARQARRRPAAAQRRRRRGAGVLVVVDVVVLWTGAGEASCAAAAAADAAPLLPPSGSRHAAWPSGAAGAARKLSGGAPSSVVHTEQHQLAIITANRERVAVRIPATLCGYGIASPRQRCAAGTRDGIPKLHRSVHAA